MNIISKRTLIQYWAIHPETEQPLKKWCQEVSKAQWNTPQDIKDQYGNASIIGNNRVVFNIKGNDHRLIVGVAYEFDRVYIKFIGTHGEYDNVDAATVEMF